MAGAGRGEHRLVCRIRNLLVPCLGGKLSRRSESMGLVGMSPASDET